MKRIKIILAVMLILFHQGILNNLIKGFDFSKSGLPILQFLKMVLVALRKGVWEYV